MAGLGYGKVEEIQAVGMTYILHPPTHPPTYLPTYQLYTGEKNERAAEHAHSKYTSFVEIILGGEAPRVGGWVGEGGA